jgi:hypothetical protein
MSLESSFSSVFKLNEHFDVVFTLKKIFLTVLGCISTDILDDVPWDKSDSVSMDKLNRLDLVVLIVVATNLPT